ncbi:MAG: response regulator transcription factor [Hungatella hathewayi]|nr:response regulator transcription factor [Hungatella hathewayi]
MIRIAIVEDDRNDMQILRGYLSRYEQENSAHFQVSTFSDGLDIVSDYKAEYDVILLDIQMKHLDGMSTAEKIRALDEDVIFIFITSTVQFAVQGYTVDALGYVLKPVPYLAFSQILGKAVRQVQKKQSKCYLTLDVDGCQMKLDMSQIFYVESQKHNILVHTEKGSYRTAGPLKRMEELLLPQGFAKCHNAYLVNLLHVTALMPNVVRLSDGTELSVSRARKKSFLDSFTDYVGGIQR